MHTRVVTSLERVGLDEPARHVWRMVRPARRRSARDHAQLMAAMAFCLRPDSNCVDVGAHRGLVLREMCRLAPRGRHIAVEPIPWLADDLRQSGLRGVEVVCAALSTTPGAAQFTVTSDASRSTLGARDGERIGVTVTTLDDLVPPDRWIDFVKVDVEGAERLVLAGGLATLRRCRPVIAFEFGRGQHRFGTTPESMHALLAGDLGMRIFDLDGAGPLSAADLGHLHATGRRWNFLARP